MNNGHEHLMRSGGGGVESVRKNIIHDILVSIAACRVPLLVVYDRWPTCLRFLPEHELINVDHTQ